MPEPSKRVPVMEKARRGLGRWGVARPGCEIADPDAVVLDSRVVVAKVACGRCGSRSVWVEDGEESCWACGRER